MPEVAQPIPFSSPRRARLLFWRRIYRFGGLALACTFFMPATKGCHFPKVPAQELLGVPSYIAEMDDVSQIPMLLMGTSILTGPYFFGCCSFFIGATILGTSGYKPRYAERIIVWWMCWHLAVLLVLLVWQAIKGIRTGEAINLGGWDLLSVGLVLISPLLGLRAIRAGAIGFLAMRWYGSVICCIWFARYLLHDPGSTRYGLWLSLAATGAMSVAALAETRVLTIQSTFSTLGSLITCRLTLRDLDRPYCSHCGYLLIGLKSARCPECGQAFDANMVHNLGES